MTWDTVNVEEAARLTKKLNVPVSYGQIDTGEEIHLTQVPHSEVREWLIISIYLRFMPLMRQIKEPLGSYRHMFHGLFLRIRLHGSETLGKICETTEQKDMTQLGIQL